MNLLSNGVSTTTRHRPSTLPLTFGSLLVFWLCALPLHSQSAGAVSKAKCPPLTRTDDVKDAYGSAVVADPYRWLEDQTSIETRAWINAENACTEAALRNLRGRDTIAQRLG